MLLKEVGSYKTHFQNSELSSRVQKIRHVRGKYKYKEEVIKKIEHDHPCKLTQTAVKVMVLTAQTALDSDIYHTVGKVLLFFGISGVNFNQ